VIGQIRSGKARLVQVSSSYVCFSQVMSIYFTLDLIKSSRVLLCQIRPGYVRLGLVKTG
jgi:hypothetical protein